MNKLDGSVKVKKYEKKFKKICKKIEKYFN